MDALEASTSDKMKWWRDARFGMFIHWGLYSQLAGEWKGQRFDDLGEWIMHGMQIPRDEYMAVAKDFNPVKYDPESWAELARKAGMKYVVITAKHHDGFCLYDSPENPFTIMNSSPYKKDLLAPLAEACRKRGLKMCFYYSQTLDWTAPGGAGYWEDSTDDVDWMVRTTERPEFDDYVQRVVKPDLKALLTNYGEVGIMWFDMALTMKKQHSQEIADYVRSLQPNCLVSGRIGNRVGDYELLGDNFHATAPVDGDWETPITLNTTFGYKYFDHDWKSVKTLLEYLINCAANGLNYLLNVGPDPLGVIPAESVQRLEQMGTWLDVYGESIYGTNPNPFRDPMPWGWITQKDNKLYLFFKDWSDKEIVLEGLISKVRKAYRLDQPEVALRFTQEADRFALTLCDEDPSALFLVVVVETEGQVQVEDVTCQDGNKAIVLPSNHAKHEGPSFQHPTGFIGDWVDETTRLTWTFRVKTAGTYSVEAQHVIHRKRLHQYNKPEVHIRVAGRDLKARVRHAGLDPAGKAYQSETLFFDEIQLETGDHTLTMWGEDFGEATVRGFRLTEVALVPDGEPGLL